MLESYTRAQLAKLRERELEIENRSRHSFWIPIIVLLFFWLISVLIEPSMAQIPNLPGTDQSDKLQAAGTLLRIIDSALFSWLSRIFSGLLILNAGISLKNQAFGMAFISIIGALVVGLTPQLVKNVFDIGGGTLFSVIESIGRFYV